MGGDGEEEEEEEGSERRLEGNTENLEKDVVVVSLSLSLSLSLSWERKTVNPIELKISAHRNFLV